jgi:hypothetical protein
MSCSKKTSRRPRGPPGGSGQNSKGSNRLGDCPTINDFFVVNHRTLPVPEVVHRPRKSIVIRVTSIRSDVLIAFARSSLVVVPQFVDPPSNVCSSCSRIPTRRNIAYSRLSFSTVLARCDKLVSEERFSASKVSSVCRLSRTCRRKMKR